MRYVLFLVALLPLTVALAATTAGAAPPKAAVPIDLAAFRVIPSESGDVVYYKRITARPPYLRAEYEPPWETTVLGYEMPEARRRSIAEIRWQWRARTLPKGGNECKEGLGDSAAGVYVTWRRGLKWYSIKYLWSATAPKGAVCSKKRGMFRAQDSVIVESGGPLGEWRTHRVDPDVAFRKHFEGGDPKADVPDLIGIGILTDGDQTKSRSAADYGQFVIVPK